LVNGFLKDQVDKASEERRRTTQILIQTYPQFLFIRDDMENFISKLKPGAKKPEEVFVEMARTPPCQ